MDKRKLYYLRFMGISASVMIAVAMLEISLGRQVGHIHLNGGLILVLLTVHAKNDLIREIKQETKAD